MSTAAQTAAYLRWLHGSTLFNASDGDAYIGGPYVADRSALFLTPEMFGAVGDDSTDDSSAIQAWIAAILATQQTGYMRKLYKCNSQIHIDFSTNATAASNGIKIMGAGPASGLDMTGCSTSPNVKIDGGTSTAAFYSTFRDFQITGNIGSSGIVLRLGLPAFGDALNTFMFENLIVSNGAYDSTAVAVQANQVLNAFMNMSVNCGSSGGMSPTFKGTAIECNQVQFCTITGSYSTGDIAVNFPATVTGPGSAGGYSFANLWSGCDFENVTNCVKSNISTASTQTFIGCQFVNSGTCFVMTNSSNYFIVIGSNKGTGNTIVSGAHASQLIWQDQFVGTVPAGSILIQPASGTDASINIAGVVSTNVSEVNLQSNVSGSQKARWALIKDGSTESGTNHGSNFQITRYDDTGAAIDNPFTIARIDASIAIAQASHKLGFFGVTPIALYATTGTGATGFTQVAATPVVSPTSTFTGNTGSTAYTLSDVVRALKLYGLLTA